MSTAPTTTLPAAARRVVLVYLAVAIAWIALSDRVAAALFPSPEGQALVSTLKGIGFVAVTSALLAWLLTRYERERAGHLARLAERERGFRLLAEHARDVIFRYRVAPERGFEYVSPAVTATLGYAPEAFLGDPAFVDRLVHSDDPPLFPLDPADVPASQLAVRRIRASDGRWVPLEVHLARATREGTDVVAIEGVARDVTERQRAEADLRRLNRVLRMMSAANRALVRAEDEPMLLATITATIVEEGGYRLAWVGAPDPDGTALRPVAHAGDAVGYLDAIAIDQRDVPEGRGPAGTSLRERRTTVIRDVATEPSMAPWREEALRRGFASVAAFPLIGRESVLGTLVIYAGEPDAFGTAEVALLEELAADLTFGLEAQRERVARTVAEAERRTLAAAVGQASESIVITDPAGTIRYVNPAFERLTGYTRDEVVGRNPRLLKSGHQPPAFYEAMWQTLAAGRTWVSDLVNRRKDGSLFTEEAVISPVLAPDGTTSGYVAVKRDVTTERAAETLARMRARERSLIAEALAALRPHDEPEQSAAAIVRQVIRLPGSAVALLLAFDIDRTATLLAGVAADGRPLGAASIAPEAGERLSARAREGPWVEGATAGHALPFEEALRSRGVVAVAYAPLHVDGEVVGVLALGSADPSGALAERLPALVEFAAIGGAVLGPNLSRRAQAARVRQRIRDVISSRAFFPVFQPIVDLSSGAVIGYEALTRFTDGTPPAQRFHEAASAGLGLGIELELATLAAALEAAQTLPDASFLNVNVSPAAILAGRPLAALLEGHDGSLVLEVTEHEAIADYPAFRAAVAALGPAVSIAVDDAGAGFSSMRHILELRPDTVKLDRSLVSGIERDPGRQAFLLGMRHFAESIACRLVAEGIETEAELAMLRSLGMHAGQGYLLGRPAPAREVVRPYA